MTAGIIVDQWGEKKKQARGKAIDFLWEQPLITDKSRRKNSLKNLTGRTSAKVIHPYSVQI